MLPHSKSIDKFNKLAECLCETNLKLQPSKYGFLYKKVAYLGHINEKGVKSCPKEIAAVQNFPTPTTAKNVREFLDLAGYYRRFINKFSQILKPLVRSSVRNAKFNWSVRLF